MKKPKKFEWRNAETRDNYFIELWQEIDFDGYILSKDPEYDIWLNEED
jgi:hypothetical protein